MGEKNVELLEKALLIKPEWGNKILDGDKVWEIRGTPTNVRGEVGLAFSGTSAVWGIISIQDCIKLDKNTFEANKDKHRINCEFEDLPYTNVFAWQLTNPKRFNQPIGYNHKRGCVIWCNLDSEFNNLLNLYTK